MRCPFAFAFAISAAHFGPASFAIASQDTSAVQADQEEREQEPQAARPLWPSLRILAVDLETDFATKTSREFILSPSSISVLERTEIQWAGTRYVSDLLRLVPGLEVQRIYSTLSNVSVRGFNDNPTASQGILGLINGRQVYNEFLGNPLWDQLMLIPEDIEEIEVIRGPGSFLYGPNAMHGLVNFITKSPLDYTDSEVSFMSAYGSYGSSLNRLRYVKRDKQAGAGLIATFVYDNIDDFEPLDGDDNMDKLYGEVRFEQDLEGGFSGNSTKSGHLFELGAGISDQNFDLLIPTFLPPVPSDHYSAKASEIYVTGKYTEGGLVAQATWTGFDSKSGSSVFYAPNEVDLDTVDVDVHYSFELLEDHDLTVGAGARHATFNTKNVDISLGRHDANLYSTYIQDEVTLVPEELFLTAGMRVDEHSEAGTNVAPRAALVWRWTKNHSLRMSYGKGHRNPSLGENWRDLPITIPGVGTATLAGNDDLDAEKMESYELGYRGWFNESRLRIGLTGFLNNVDNIVVFQLVGPLTAAPVNQDEQRVYGIEIDAEFGFSDSLSTFGNYSYSTRENRETGDRITIGPKNKANLGLRYSAIPENSADRTVDAMAWLTFFDDTEFNFPGGEVDEYLLLNGSVSYNFRPLRTRRGSVFLKAFNLLDNDHRENPEGAEYGLIVQAGFRLSW